MENSLDELAEELEVLDDAAMQVDGETLGVGVHGNVHYQGVIIPETVLWSSEEDVRLFDEEKDEYIESVQEYVFRKIEETATKMLKTVERARNTLDRWSDEEGVSDETS